MTVTPKNVEILTDGKAAIWALAEILEGGQNFGTETTESKSQWEAK